VTSGGSTESGVDKDVDLAEAGDDRLGHPAGVGRDCDVCGNGQRFTSSLSHGGRRRFQGWLGTSDQPNPGSGTGEPAGQHCAQPWSGAHDQCHLIIEC
jgi:hypothetical protein